MNATTSPQRQRQAPEILVGVLDRERWRPADYQTTGSAFVIATLEDQTTVEGNAPAGELQAGMAYRFFGNWEAAQPGSKYPPAFRFREFAKSEPVSPGSLQTYLVRHCKGIGPRIAARLWAAYGVGAVKILRTDPQTCAREIEGLTEPIAREAAQALGAIAGAEDLRIELGELLAGRGFPRSATDAVIRRWGLLAPAKIRRNPFHLLQAKIPGAGFLRCDRLYLDLGHDPQNAVRQVYALEHWMSRDSDGHTWFSGLQAGQILNQTIGGAAPNLKKAVRIGGRLKRLAVRVDEAGQSWLATWENAEAERRIADGIHRLTQPRLVQVQHPTPLDEQEAAASPPRDLQDIETAPAAKAAAAAEELRAIGRATGVCQICRRALTSPESVAAGIGPICAARLSAAVTNASQRKLF